MIAIVYLLLPGRRLSTNLQTACRSHNDFRTCVSCTFESQCLVTDSISESRIIITIREVKL